MNVFTKEHGKVLYFTSPPYFHQLDIQRGASVQWILKGNQRPFIRIIAFPNLHKIHYKGLKSNFDEQHPLSIVFNTLA